MIIIRTFLHIVKDVSLFAKNNGANINKMILFARLHSWPAINCVTTSNKKNILTFKQKVTLKTKTIIPNQLRKILMKFCKDKIKINFMTSSNMVYSVYKRLIPFFLENAF